VGGRNRDNGKWQTFKLKHNGLWRKRLVGQSSNDSLASTSKSMTSMSETASSPSSDDIGL
jgi:hypothetical protein